MNKPQQSTSEQNETGRPSVTVRAIGEQEVEWFEGQLREHHYLGAGRPVGDYLRQVVEREGKRWHFWYGDRVVTRSKTGINGSAGVRPSGSGGSS